MKNKNSISALFTALNIFLAVIITAAGIIFFAGYLFKNSDSGVVSAFGYSLHIAGDNDVQPSVKKGTFITAQNTTPKALENGQLVTVVTVDGRTFSANYYTSPAEQPQKPYLFIKSGSTETIALSGFQIKSVALHLYHSDVIGQIFSTFAVNRTPFLISEFLLLLILVISLLLVISRREKIKLPRPKRRSQKPKTYNLENLITVEKNVEFEKSRNKNE